MHCLRYNPARFPKTLAEPMPFWSQLKEYFRLTGLTVLRKNKIVRILDGKKHIPVLYSRHIRLAEDFCHKGE